MIVVICREICNRGDKFWLENCQIYCLIRKQICFWSASINWNSFFFSLSDFHLQFLPGIKGLVHPNYSIPIVLIYWYIWYTPIQLKMEFCWWYSEHEELLFKSQQQCPTLFFLLGLRNLSLKYDRNGVLICCIHYISKHILQVAC